MIFLYRKAHNLNQVEILIYAKGETAPLHLLRRETKNAIPNNCVYEFRNIDTLSLHLKHNSITKNSRTITILLIHDHEELDDLVQMHSHLSETRIILILPDKEPATVKLGHQLFPRYQDFIDSNFAEVGEVLKKLKQTAS